MHEVRIKTQEMKNQDSRDAFFATGTLPTTLAISINPHGITAMMGIYPCLVKVIPLGDFQQDYGFGANDVGSHVAAE